MIPIPAENSAGNPPADPAPGCRSYAPLRRRRTVNARPGRSMPDSPTYESGTLMALLSRVGCRIPGPGRESRIGRYATTPSLDPGVPPSSRPASWQQSPVTHQPRQYRCLRSAEPVNVALCWLLSL